MIRFNSNLASARLRNQAFRFSLRHISAVIVGMFSIGSAWAASSTTTLAAPPSETPVGQAVTLTATVTATGFTVNCGLCHVTFKEGSQTLGTVYITNANGTASYVVPGYSTTGSHTYTASFADGLIYPSTSAPVSTTVRFPTTTTLSSSASSTHGGDAVTLTANVSGGTPTGIVAFLDGNVGIGNVQVSGGIATLRTTFLTASGHNITAVYNGGYSDQKTMPSTSGVVAVNVSGRDYFVNPTTGNDSNTQGTELAPWASLTNVNNTTMASGSVVKLACGSTWRATLAVQSGVTYDSNPSGCANQPVITGADPVANVTWAQDPADPTGNIWMADVTYVFPTPITQLFDGTTRLVRARHPNIGQGSYVKDANGNAIGRYDQMLAGSKDGAGHFSNGGYLAHLNLTATQQQAAATEGWAGAEMFMFFDGYALPAYTLSDDPSGWPLATFDAKWSSSLYNFPLYNTINGQDTTQPYWVENKKWMLDAANEWFYEVKTTSSGTARKLYVYGDPRSKTLTASVRDNAIVANGKTDFTLSNIAVTSTGHDGVALKQPSNFNVQYTTVKSAGFRGIYIEGGGNGSLTSNTIQMSRSSALSAGHPGDNGTLTGTGHSYLNNIIKNAGDQLLAQIAFKMALNSNGIGNQVDVASGSGIFVDQNSTLTTSKVTNVCNASVDCGGIYVLGRDDAGHNGLNNNVNLIRNRVDSLVLLPSEDKDKVGKTGRGIYLDDFATNVRVLGNYVTGASTGIILHIARDITMTNNWFVGNSGSQIFMYEASGGGGYSVDCTNPTTQATSQALQLNCDSGNYMVANTVAGNVLVATSPGQTLVAQDTHAASTSDFATYGVLNGINTPNTYVSFVADYPFSNHDELNQFDQTLTYADWTGVLGKDVGTGVRFIPNPVTQSTVLGLVAPQVCNMQQYLDAPFTATPSCIPDELGNVNMARRVQKAATTGWWGMFGSTSGTLPVHTGDAYLVTFDVLNNAPNASSHESVRISLTDTSIGQAVTPYTSAPVLQQSGWQHGSSAIVYANGNASNSRIDITSNAKDITLANLQMQKVSRVAQSDRVLVFDNFGASTNKTVSNCGISCASYVDATTGANVGTSFTVAPNTVKVLVKTP